MIFWQIGRLEIFCVCVLLVRLRELLIKKMQLNYGLLPKRSDPPSPPRLSELLGHFFVG